MRSARRRGTSAPLGATVRPPVASQVQTSTDSEPRARWALTVLLLAYILSFIDRNVMAILVGPIRESFEIGPKFGWIFIVAGSLGALASVLRWRRQRRFGGSGPIGRAWMASVARVRPRVLMLPRGPGECPLVVADYYFAYFAAFLGVAVDGSGGGDGVDVEALVQSSDEGDVAVGEHELGASAV